jgi:hypothetical protein
MFNKLICILLLIFLFFLGCSKNDDHFSPLTCQLEISSYNVVATANDATVYVTMNIKNTCNEQLNYLYFDLKFYYEDGTVKYFSKYNKLSEVAPLQPQESRFFTETISLDGKGVEVGGVYVIVPAISKIELISEKTTLG